MRKDSYNKVNIEHALSAILDLCIERSQVFKVKTHIEARCLVVPERLLVPFNKIYRSLYFFKRFRRIDRIYTLIYPDDMFFACRQSVDLSQYFRLKCRGESAYSSNRDPNYQTGNILGIVYQKMVFVLYDRSLHNLSQYVLPDRFLSIERRGPVRMHLVACIIICKDIVYFISLCYDCRYGMCCL